MTAWPALPLAEWIDTQRTLHRWMQIVGKIKLEFTPLVNHWWNVTFFVTARGLTTSQLRCGATRWFEMEFDFIDHLLHIRVNDGGWRDIKLEPKSVAAMYREIFRVLPELGIQCTISKGPVELIDEIIPLDQDESHHTYDPDPAQRFWRILGLSALVFTEFRSRFIGKCSPVHFFWGSFDLAVTRFSGRPAPARPEADAVTREAYSHEVSSVGWWPGDTRLPKPTYYSYAAPEPAGFRDAKVKPSSASYNANLFGFYLDYDDVRKASDPDAMLLDFCQSTYEPAAILGRWDRDLLERPR